jgi:phage-related protein
MNIFTKLLKWLPLNLAGLIGIIQGIIKVIKEILTAIINILFPIIPGEGNFEKIVLKIRDIVNKVDEVVEKIKGFFLKAAN